MSDYIESLFQGVDILIDKKLENLAFDTTAICTITDDSNSKNGEYQVTDGSVTYIAYSEEDKYKKGNQVRVSIPNNDYSQKKFILGKYAAEDKNLPITYVSSTDTIVNISGNLANNIIDSKFGIGAGGPVKKKIIWNKGFNAQELENLQSANIYNTIILKADFKTLFSNYELINGNYGLYLDLLIRPSLNSPSRIRRTFSFDSSEMFGDPYNFSIFSTQTKVFSCANLDGIIEGIELSLYQNNNFENKNKQYIKTDSEDVFHILVTKIEVGFGCDVSTVEDNVVQIYSPNSLNYNYNLDTEETNLKRIELAWYNKDDNNKYLGFSDGYYDEDYDEIEYLNLMQVDSRLMAQKGRENIPLDAIGLRMAADLEDVVSLTKKIIKLMSQDLYQALRNLQSALAGAYTIDNEHEYSLSALLDESQEEKFLINLINKILIESDLETHEEGFEPSSDLGKIYINYTKWLSSISKKEQIEDLLITDLTNNSLSQIKQKCLNFINKIQEVQKHVADNLKAGGHTAFDGVLDVYGMRVTRALNLMLDILETFPDFEANYDNNLFNNYLTNYKWRDYPIYQEQDLSAYANRYCIYWYKYEQGYRASYAEESYQLVPENWRRLTEYNNIGIPKLEEPELMNPALNPPNTSYIEEYLQNDTKEQRYMAIVFYDHNIYKSNELVFTNIHEVPNKVLLDKSEGLIFTHLKNSQDSYQIYAESNCLFDGADEVKMRQIRCGYNGTLMTEEELLKDASIYWYVPLSSMITYDKDLLVQQGFVTDLDEETKPEYSMDGYTCFYKKIKLNSEETDPDKKYIDSTYHIDTRDFWYKIKPYYEATAINNYILCKIIPFGETLDYLESRLFFTFGIAGSSGTRYTLAIVNEGGQIAVQHDKDLILNLSLRDANNEKIDLKSVSEAMFSQQKLFKCGTTFNINKISDDQRYRVESAGQGCGIVKFNLANYPLDDGRKITFSQLHAIPWSAADYYLSGTTKIIYNGMGTVDRDSLFTTPYKLFNAVTGEEIEVKWSVEYYNSNGSSISSEKTVYLNFLPTISEDNCLVPATMYFEGIENECGAVVIAKDASNNILWKQPIIITQNRYGYPILNEWDGKFKVDEKNNVILSAMIGAGRKNSSNNTFDGVLMGDLETTNYTPTGGVADRSSMIGLYGFNNGAQSFGFKIDGTAFIGTAGAGRIEFDGTQAIIKSGNYSNVSGSEAGMLINLKEGSIDAYNFKLTSKNITINSNPSVNSPYFEIQSSSTEDNILLYIGNGNGYYLKSDGLKQDSILDADRNLLKNLFGTGNPPKGVYLDLAGNIYVSNYGYASGDDNDTSHDVFDNITGAIAGYIGDTFGLGSSGLFLNSQAQPLAPALACGGFRVNGNGSLSVNGNWILNLKIGALTRNGIAPLGGVVDAITGDGGLGQLIGGVINGLTDISWWHLYLAAMRVKLLCTVPDVPLIIPGVGEIASTQDSINAIFSTLFLSTSWV